MCLWSMSRKTRCAQRERERARERESERERERVSPDGGRLSGLMKGGPQKEVPSSEIHPET